VHVESDWFFRFIRSGFIAPHLPASREQNDAVMDLVSDAVVGYSRARYVVFWDGIVGPWYLERAAGRLAAAHLRVHYVPLRVSRRVGLERVARRDGTTTASGAEVMHDQMANFAAFEHLVVNTDGAPRQTMLDIQAGLAVGRFAIAGRP
jgi:hypothetical protein